MVYNEKTIFNTMVVTRSLRQRWKTNVYEIFREWDENLTENFGG